MWFSRSFFWGYFMPIFVIFEVLLKPKTEGVSELEPFSRGISPKVNVMAHMELELTYYNVEVQRLNHYTTTTLPRNIYVHYAKLLLFDICSPIHTANIKAIIIITMSRYQHGYSCSSLATPPYRPLLSADPQGYIPYRHRAAVCRFELDIQPLPVHVKGSTGVHHL